MKVLISILTYIILVIAKEKVSNQVRSHGVVWIVLHLC